MRKPTMITHKGYDISTTTILAEQGNVTEVGCSAIKAGKVVYCSILPGPFDSKEDARAAGAWTVRNWIDQHGT